MIVQRRATIDDLGRVHGKAELIDGKVVEFMPTGRRPGRVALEIAVRLRDYARQTGRGEAHGDNVGYVVPELSSGRESFSPDASYYDGPPQADDMKFIDGPPTFAVEVRSEGDYGPAADAEYAAKRADYFEAGTQCRLGRGPGRQDGHPLLVRRPNQPGRLPGRRASRRRADATRLAGAGRGACSDRRERGPEAGGRTMTTTVEAIYQDGVFKPVGPVDLPENQRVRVVVPTEEPPRRGVPLAQVLGMAARPRTLKDIVGSVPLPGPAPTDEECDQMRKMRCERNSDYESPPRHQHYPRRSPGPGAVAGRGRSDLASESRRPASRLHDRIEPHRHLLRRAESGRSGCGEAGGARLPRRTDGPPRRRGRPGSRVGIADPGLGRRSPTRLCRSTWG